MKLYFKQHAFTVLGNAEILDEYGNIAYTVRGHMSFGAKLTVYDRTSHEVGTVRQALWTWKPKFEIYLGDEYIGAIKKESFFSLTPRYSIDYNGWSVEGSCWEWDYVLRDRSHRTVASVSKERFKISDRYTLDIYDEGDVADPLTVLMFVIAIDAEKASRSS